jgi:hypothetical protein
MANLAPVVALIMSPFIIGCSCMLRQGETAKKNALKNNQLKKLQLGGISPLSVF